MSEDTETPLEEPPQTIQQQMADMEKLLQLQLRTMKLQQEMIHNPPHPAPTTSSPSVVKQVKVPEGRYTMNLSEFRTYKKDCADYKTLTGYSNQQVVMQMRLNMDADLKRAIDTNFRDEWDNFTVEDAVKTVGEIINQISNIAVYRKEFNNMEQLRDEPIREYITRLKSCSLDCNFVCPYEQSHDLTDYHIIDRIRCGIHDRIMQQELLQKSDTLESLSTITQFCEHYESAKKDSNKLSAPGVGISLAEINTLDMSQEEVIAAISTYKKSKKDFDQKQQKDFDQKQQKCRSCGYIHRKNTCPAQGHTCRKCKKRNHFEQCCWSTSTNTDKNVSAILFNSIEVVVNSNSQENIHSLPRLTVKMSRNQSASLNINIECIADTGAQISVASPSYISTLGIQLHELTKPYHILKHAGGTALDVIGSYNLFMQHNGESIEAEVYFVKGVTNFYLSLDVCKSFNLIHQEFPFATVNTSSVAPPKRPPSMPERPAVTPLPPTKENIHLLEKWLLEEFASTTFNTECYPLPLMSGKPQKFHLMQDAIPHAANVPIPIPHHWKSEIKEQLDKDVAMGILQKAPVGEVTEWCMKMVTVQKKDGTPRRTIDFQPINKYCLREPHHTARPIDIVSNIPPKSYKSILDAYSGYHQVPLDPDSVKLTTFITEFGRYQYLRAPQGHVASGDAYTRRYDDIISHVENKQKYVDDVLLHDSSIEDAFFRVFDYLMLCYQNGITISPKKFAFAREEVEFAGFKVGWEKYTPSDNMLASIQSFPMPVNPKISDIRAWFGLVNQIAPFIASSKFMEPF